ncbi:MAG TPA: OmpH family outer membrane protein [Chitinophagaceae bacterium]|nr:OmpH family outer membrane protein [Chitinophagaceae bacterium]MCC6634219.1 OmpH family outer membrane protein [Chitinophagaceae bacterium]HMZ45283.1 OmpH family outer membrane protein [Chitinophagaceae bacterium]HNE93068.1 OmpH family outer membrane protein [Chitinophagaceae bacterium]HNF29886.1 OmpH family outer membrane protein [Chitinophagaceae bacterium]
MKKVFMACAALVISLAATTKSNAQQIKIGMFDEEAVLQFMPGISKVDTLLHQFVEDSLQNEYEDELYLYQTKDSTFKADSSKMSNSLKLTLKKEIALHFNKLQNWQQYQQQRLQIKQQELLRPYLEKIYGALQAIIIEQKYTHIFKKDVFVHIEKGEELMLRVLHKLKVPVPKEIEEQYKSFGIGGASATKPTTTPKKN